MDVTIPILLSLVTVLMGTVMFLLRSGNSKAVNSVNHSLEKVERSVTDSVAEFTTSVNRLHEEMHNQEERIEQRIIAVHKRIEKMNSEVAQVGYRLSALEAKHEVHHGG